MIDLVSGEALSGARPRARRGCLEKVRPTSRFFLTYARGRRRDPNTSGIGTLPSPPPWLRDPGLGIVEVARPLPPTGSRTPSGLAPRHRRATCLEVERRREVVGIASLLPIGLDWLELTYDNEESGRVPATLRDATTAGRGSRAGVGHHARMAASSGTRKGGSVAERGIVEITWHRNRPGQFQLIYVEPPLEPLHRTPAGGPGAC